MTADMLLVALVTAIFTSSFTLLGAFALYRLVLAKKIAQALEAMGDEHVDQLRRGLEQEAGELLPQFRAEVTSGFEQAAKEILPEFRQEVEAGFEQAATEILPSFREEVEKGLISGAEKVLPDMRKEVEGGVRDALVGVASVDFVDQTAQNVAKKSTRLFESGLNAIFGRGKRKKE